MEYHLIWNHGYEVWNDDGYVCQRIKWFESMNKALVFIDLCKLTLLF